MNPSIRSLLLLAPAAVIGLLPNPGAAQIPDTYKNLRILPKDIAKPALVKTMRQWASDLGVRCRHCHAGPDDLQGMDFATDEKPTKRAAREMVRMVAEINAGAMKALPPREEPRASVTCATCHRGAPRPPLPLDVELSRAAASGGGDAAVARYRELRRDHEADGQYDFSLRALGAAATRLAEAGRLDDAIVVARAAKDENPRVPEIHVLLGELLLRKGDRAQAAESFRSALALDPQHGGAQRGLKKCEEPKPN